MTIFLPDPDIGRCQNVRYSHCACGMAEGLRCLDYDGTQHTCEFPEPTHVCAPQMGQSTYTITSPKPKPWVKPSGRKGES